MQGCNLIALCNTKSISFEAIIPCGISLSKGANTDMVKTIEPLFVGHHAKNLMLHKCWIAETSFCEIPWSTCFEIHDNDHTTSLYENLWLSSHFPFFNCHLPGLRWTGCLICDQRRNCGCVLIIILIIKVFYIWAMKMIIDHRKQTCTFR